MTKPNHSARPKTKTQETTRRMSGRRKKGLIPSKSKQRSNSIETISASALKGKNYPPLRYAIDGLLTEGLTLLGGKPKIGKSYMALDFAMAVASGGVALGSVECQQGAVLYCALEDNHRRLQRRMKQLYGVEETWPRDLHFATSSPRLDGGLVDELREWIDTHDAKLVIIDTFAGVRPRGRGEGYDADYAALSPLQEMAGDMGVAILVIHHLRKMQGDDPFDTISGTTGLTGAVDAAFVLQRGQQGVTLYGRGREIEEMEKALEFDGGSWTVLGDATDVRRSEERGAILAVLSDASAPIGPKDIAEALGKPENNVKQLLFKMLKDGEIKKRGRGQYCIPDT